MTLFVLVLVAHTRLCSGGAELLFDKVKQHKVKLPDGECMCLAVLCNLLTL